MPPVFGKPKFGSSKKRTIPRIDLAGIAHAKRVIAEAVARYPDAVRCTAFLDELMLEADEVRKSQSYLAEKQGWVSALKGRVTLGD